ncbi:molybdopterin-dependent oxidoreductase [Kordiimonas lacus]|uniref:molybdopterin-dependent oxidoreductase n=1 Tax=Kordiimonas lacus TaxID=637679 RepID=UPI00082C7009
MSSGETIVSELRKTHYRSCHLCEAICGIAIETEGDRIVSIKGDKDDPFSRGHICPKATAIQDLYTDPDRLTKPIRRVGDEWQEISWDEAFELVAEKMVAIQDVNGPNSIGFFAGNPGVHNYGTMTHGSELRRAIGTDNHFSATSLDQLPHMLVGHLMYGHQYLVPVADIDHTNFMLIIGGNPLASNGSMMTVPDVKNRLKGIQDRGGKFVVIDPRRTETAAIADEHHFIRPGSDAFLLMAMIQTVFAEDLVNLGPMAGHIDGLEAVRAAAEGFTPELAAEQTGISADVIRDLARTMATTEGAAAYGRMGVSTQVFGTLCQWAIQVLNIITGNMDVPGGIMVPTPAFGNVTPGTRGAGYFATKQSRVSGLPIFSGEFPAVALAEEINTPGEGQIKGLFTIAANPALSAPNGGELNKAFEGLDFMVSIDLYLNETTRFADVILPPTSPLEHDHYDISFNRLAVRNITRYNAPVFDPPAGTKHDWEIMIGLAAAIAKRKGQDYKPQPAPHVLLDQGIQYGPYGKATGAAMELTLEKLKDHPHGIDLGPLQPSMPERLSGPAKLDLDLMLDDLKRLMDSRQALKDGELLLIGRRHVRSNNSWMHNSTRLIKGPARWHLMMHPSDMAARDIKDGARVGIASRVGEVETLVVASEDVMPGVVSLPHGWGHQTKGVKLAVASEQEGVNCNILTDDKLFDPVSGNAALNGVPVTVRQCA